MLVSFCFRLDDYVGRPQIIAFALSNKPIDTFPAEIAKEFNPDMDEYDITQFVNRVKEICPNGEKLSSLAFYF